MVFHADYYFQAIQNSEKWSEKLQFLELLDQVIVFGVFDSGGHYGYCIYQNAKLLRKISQDVADDYEIFQFGEVLNTEKEWLNSNTCYLYSYLDENDEFQEKLIDGKDIDISSIDEWEIGDYLKCRYIASIDNYMAEENLVSYLFSKLCLEIIKIDLISENIDIHISLSTSTGTNQMKESEQSLQKVDFFTRFKQFWKK